MQVLIIQLHHQFKRESFEDLRDSTQTKIHLALTLSSELGNVHEDSALLKSCLYAGFE